MCVRRRSAIVAPSQCALRRSHSHSSLLSLTLTLLLRDMRHSVKIDGRRKTSQRRICRKQGASLCPLCNKESPNDPTTQRPAYLLLFSKSGGWSRAKEH